MAWVLEELLLVVREVGLRLHAWLLSESVSMVSWFVYPSVLMLWGSGV